MAEMIKQYPYRMHLLVALPISSVFIAAGCWIVWEQVHISCSTNMTFPGCVFDPPANDVLATVFLILVGVLNIGLFLKVLWESYLSFKNPLRRRIAFTDDSIIGPVSNIWNTKALEINFNEVSEFDLIHNQHGVLIRIKTDYKNLVIDRRYMVKEEFAEIYEMLAKKFQRPPLYQVLNTKVQASDSYYTLSFIPYMFFPIFLSSLFMDNGLKQVDDLFIFFAGFISNVLFLFLFLRLISRFKKPNNQGFLFAICCLMGAFSFILGFAGFPALISYFNQLGDGSIEQKMMTSLIQVKSQSKESKMADGICFQFRDFDEPDSGFGDDLCQRDYPTVNEQTKAEVYLKRGNFNQRWVYRFTLPDLKK